MIEFDGKDNIPLFTYPEMVHTVGSTFVLLMFACGPAKQKSLILVSCLQGEKMQCKASWLGTETLVQPD